MTASVTTARERWEQWQLDRTSAETYESYLAVAFTPWADRLIELVDLQPGQQVLDVACGTGIVARRAAPRIGAEGRITGLDLNEAMLAVAQTAASGSEPAIEWRQGDAAELPFDDESFDVVFCHQGLQFMPEPVAALREMRRVLAPDGRLALNVCRPVEYAPAYGPLAEILGRRIGAHAETMMRSPFPDWQVDDLLTKIVGAGLRDVHISIDIASGHYPSAAELVGLEAASSPLAGAYAALSEDERAALVAEVTDALHDFIDDDGLLSPIQTYFAHARR